MKLTKDQIIGALPTLGHADLKAINAVTAHLLGQGLPDPQNHPNGPQAWLFVALQGVLNGAYRPPDSLKAFNKNAPAVIKFVADGFGVHFLDKKVEAMALLNGLVCLLRDDLKDRKVPVTYKTMTEHLPRLPEVFERSFPGYLDSGLAGLFLVRR